MALRPSWRERYRGRPGVHESIDFQCRVRDAAGGRWFEREARDPDFGDASQRDECFDESAEPVRAGFAGRAGSGREDNERGFFEPGKVIGIHEEMFRTLGSSWDDVLGIPRKKLTGGETADFRQRLLEALREDLGDSRQFVLKDPRFCRLLPMWRLILAEFGAQPSCILTIRNPLDVAASLEARMGLRKISRWCCG